MTNPHKYNTPEWMVWRLKEWIGTHGGEDSTTLMVFEAQKTIERMQQELTDAAATINEVIEGKDKLYAALWSKYDDSRTHAKALEDALRPFASVPLSDWDGAPDESPAAGSSFFITVGDLRRAAALLEKS